MFFQTSSFFRNIFLVIGLFMPLFSHAAAAPAQASGGVNPVTLQQIETNTRGANNALSPMQGTMNKILGNVEKILKEMLSWNDSDKDDKVGPVLQNLFSLYGAQYIQTLNAQNSDTNKVTLLDAMFDPELDTDKLSPAENDLSYFTLLNSGYIPKEYRKSSEKSKEFLKKLDLNNASLNYILNASGARIPHEPMGKDWTGRSEAKRRYLSQYSTSMSVQSYGSYVLSQMLADQRANNEMQVLQNKLLTQATDGKNWFTQVLHENIHTVVRHILMYESQNYVLLSQLLEVQKQQLAAQVMTNSLLILNNQDNESSLARKAKDKDAL